MVFAEGITLPPGRYGLSGPTITAERPQRLSFVAVAANATIDPARISATGCAGPTGLRAAFEESNRNGGVGGIQLNVLLRDSPDFPLGVTGARNAAEAITSDDAFGVASVVYGAAVLTQLQLGPLGIPVFGAAPDEPDVWYATSARNAIMQRTSSGGEVYQLLNYGLNHAHCTHFGVLVLRLSENLRYASLFQGLIDGLADQGFNVSATVVAIPLQQQDNISRYVDEMYATSTPQCVVVSVAPNDGPAVVAAVRAHPKQLLRTTFLFPSVGAPPGDKFPLDADGGYASFDDVFVTQVVPDPRSATSPLAQKFRAAIALVAPDPTFPSCHDNAPTHKAFEGYLTGRLIIETLNRMHTVSRENFLDTVYRSKMYQFDELTLGPFRDDCTQTQRATGETTTCFCNVAGQSVFTSKVDLSSGYLEAAQDSVYSGEFGVVQLSFPLNECAFSPSQVKVPALHLVLTTPADWRDPALMKMVLHYITLSIGLSKTTQGTDRRLLLFNVTIPNATPSALPFIDAANERYKPMGFAVANSLENSDILPRSYPTVAGLGRDVLREDDPPFRFNSFTLLPSLADHVHTLAAFAHYSLHETVHIWASTASEARLAEQSAHTFQRMPVEITVAALDTDIVPAHKIVLVVSQSAPFLRRALSQAHRHPTTTFLVACSEELLETVAVAGQLDVGNVFFASAFPQWWGRGSAYSRALETLARHGSTAIGRPSDPNATIGVAQLRLHLLTQLLFEGGRQAKTPQGMSAWLYQSGERKFDEVTVGPFSRLPCEEDGDDSLLCECNNGMQHFFVHSLGQWVSFVHPLASNRSANATSFTYSHEQCNVMYRPLASSSASVTTLVVVVVVVGVVAVVAITAALVATRKRGRDNSLAPTDPNTPFAIVFTDIQASTTLWASVPEEMSAGVELHHRLIRALIATHHGYEVKTIGDSFMVAFKRPSDAATFAVALQTVFFEQHWNPNFDTAYEDHIRSNADLMARLTEEDFNRMVDRSLWHGLRVRVGVHYGLGDIQLDPVSQGYDYYGTVVNTAARVEGVGHGGQVLLTKAAHDAVFGSDAPRPLPPTLHEAVVKGLGPQPLRGLATDVTLCQLVPAPVAGRYFPRLRLDVMVCEIQEDSCSGTSAAEEDTVEGLAAHLSRQRGMDDVHQLGLYQVTTQSHLAVETLLSTSNAEYRSKFLRHVAQKWHVPSKAKSDTLLLVQVMSRVAATINARARRGSLSKPTSDLLEASADRLSAEEFQSAIGSSDAPRKQRVSRTWVTAGTLDEPTTENVLERKLSSFRKSRGGAVDQKHTAVEDTPNVLGYIGP